LGYIFYFNYE